MTEDESKRLAELIVDYSEAGWAPDYNCRNCNGSGEEPIPGHHGEYSICDCAYRTKIELQDLLEEYSITSKFLIPLAKMYLATKIKL